MVTPPPTGPRAKYGNTKGVLKSSPIKSPVRKGRDDVKTRVLSLKVECCIVEREKILNRLSRYKTETTSNTQEKIDRLLVALRSATLETILSIEKWSQHKNGFGISCKKEAINFFSQVRNHVENVPQGHHMCKIEDYSCFLWNGTSYLSKISFDCKELSARFDLTNHFGKICGIQGRTYSAERNPLFLPFTADELVLEEPIGPLSADTVQKLCADATGLPSETIVPAMVAYIYEEMFLAVKQCLLDAWRLNGNTKIKNQDKGIAISDKEAHPITKSLENSHHERDECTELEQHYSDPKEDKSEIKQFDNSKEEKILNSDVTMIESGVSLSFDSNSNVTCCSSPMLIHNSSNKESTQTSDLMAMSNLENTTQDHKVS